MRAFLRTAATLLLVSLPMAHASAQGEATIDPAEFATPGPLGDKGLGDPGAPVMLVEYASLTCSHCGSFHNETFDALKEKYIDTGKVYFVLREFPLDSLALAASMIARCGAEDAYFDIIDTMFTEQANWAWIENPGPALFALVEPFGLDDAAVNACLNDQEILEGIVANAKRGHDYGVAGTPAFFFNGLLRAGPMTIDRLDEILGPMLAEAEGE